MQLACVQIKESSPLFQTQNDRPDLIDQAVHRDINLVIEELRNCTPHSDVVSLGEGPVFPNGQMPNMHKRLAVFDAPIVRSLTAR